jgi:hypothetical protein
MEKKRNISALRTEKHDCVFNNNGGNLTKKTKNTLSRIGSLLEFTDKALA